MRSLELTSMLMAVVLSALVVDVRAGSCDKANEIYQQSGRILLRDYVTFTGRRRYVECTWVIHANTSMLHVDVRPIQWRRGGCNDFIEVSHFRGGSSIRNEKICHNDDGRGEKSTDFSLGEGDTVRVRYSAEEFTDFHLDFFPIKQWRQETLGQTSTTGLACQNGGTVYKNVCICPPGFYGEGCEKACGPGQFGDSCDEMCSGNFMGCLKQRFCVGSPAQEQQVRSLYSGPSVCSCAAGVKGSDCEQACDRGEYGANCSERCGFCARERECDPFTGHCTGGCLPGYTPPFCKEALAYLVGALNITNISSTSISGVIEKSPQTTRGGGKVQMYELQYKEITADEWSTGAIGHLCSPGTDTCTLPFTVDGLRPNTKLLVRALLLDETLQSFPNVGQIVIQTGGQRQVSDVSVSDVNARSARVSWATPVKAGPFFVRYECVALPACPGESCDAANGMLVVASDSVLLEGLLPFAKYRVTVATDDEAEDVSVMTQMTVPDAVPTGLQPSLITNTTAVLRWRPAALCGEANGPAASFRWALHAGDGNDTSPLREATTNTMVVMLRELTPLTDYELRVRIVNVMGVNPDRFASVHFRTLHTEPDEPRSMAVYRLNETALWLRWLPPARPSGELRRYVVEIKGPGLLRAESVSPSSACAAYPGMLCHALYGLQPDQHYDLAVSAVNEYGDEPGQNATLRAATTLGVPGPVRSLGVKSQDLSAGSVVLQWQLPDLVNNDLTFFEVVVVPKNGTNRRPRKQDVHVTEEKLWYTGEVANLQPGSTYAVAVSCGWNGQAAEMQFSMQADSD